MSDETLQADGEQIARLFDLLFHHASRDGKGDVSFRLFCGRKSGVHGIQAKALEEGGGEEIVAAAADVASRVANEPEPVAFALLIAAFFDPDRATKVDLREGLALSDA